MLTAIAALALAPTITGRVLDADGAPVPHAAVILCDAATGVPLHNGAPFVQADDMETALADITFHLTDESGAFAFTDLPAADYKLLAQSWIGAEPAALLDVNARTVHIRGGARISLDEDAHIDLTPLGDATLVIADLAPNSETLIAVSAEPLAGDPILSFGAWAGPFTQSMLGFNRMPDGVTTFRGLPDGDVHLATFSADNNPANGGATVAVSADQPMWVDIPFIGTWSDAVHAPPPHLEALTDRIAAMPPDAQYMLALRFMPENEPRSALHALAAAAAHVDEEVTLPGGDVARGGDVMAALGYAMIRRGFRQSGRELNPWRAPTIRPATPAEAAR